MTENESLARLFPYQREGVMAAVKQFRCRALIADDMGLGKTPQAIGAAMVYPEAQRYPVVVVCPASLRYNWRKEWLQWWPTLREEDICIVEPRRNARGEAPG